LNLPILNAPLTQSDYTQRAYVNGRQYIDERVVMRDLTGTDGKDYYYLHQELYSVAGLAAANGNLVEACTYDAYGSADLFDWPAGDFDRDGDVDSTDTDFMEDNYGQPASYVFLDLDMDGDADSDDRNLMETSVASPLELTYSSLDNPFLFTGRLTNTLDADDQLTGNDPHFKRLQDNRNRTYDPKHGRWLQRDPEEYVDGINLYEYCGSNSINNVDPMGLKDYKIGKGSKPDIKWDNYYKYDPNEEPTRKDYINWYKYGALLLGADLLARLPDATRAYRHYRDATGTDLSVNYNKAIRRDTKIREYFKAEITGAQNDIEREHDGKLKSFTVYSKSVRNVRCDTENWQKALGGHPIWGTREVSFSCATCKYTLKIFLNVEDFYNFNPRRPSE